MPQHTEGNPHMTTTATEPSEARVEDLMATVRFLYPDEQYPHDETTIRAMIVQGGTDEQIREAVAVAAINMRVDRESKTRYAAGVLRNLMHPRAEYDDDPGDDAYDYGDSEPTRARRWPFRRGFDESVHG